LQQPPGSLLIDLDQPQNASAVSLTPKGGSSPKP
jgi:hypothetical protein